MYYSQHNENQKSIDFIKLSIKQDMEFANINNFMTAINILLDNNEPDLTIELIGKYFNENKNRYQLYVKISKAYLMKKDYQNAIDSLTIAKNIYQKNYSSAYSSIAEKEISDLEKQINLLPH